MGTEPHDAEYWKKKIAALETFLCWVQTGQRKFDGYDLFVDNTLNIMRQIRPVAQVDYQGRAVPIGLLPDSEGTKHQQVGTHGRAFVEDDWGQVLTNATQTAHTVGTTIVVEFAVPAGFEWRLLEAFDIASRAPDTLHDFRLFRKDAGGTSRAVGILWAGTTAVSGYWPWSNASTAAGNKYVIHPIVMKAEDSIQFRITNNAQAGDTLDTIFTYQSRSVE